MTALYSVQYHSLGISLALPPKSAASLGRQNFNLQVQTRTTDSLKRQQPPTNNKADDFWKKPKISEAHLIFCVPPLGPAV